MRTKLLVLGLAFVSVAACKSSHDEAARAAPPTAAPAPPAPPPSPSSATPSEPWQQIGISMQAPPGSTEGTGCDAVLPPGFRADGGFGGLGVSESGGRGSLRCAFIDPNDRAHQRVFEYNCDAPAMAPAEMRMRRDRFAQQASDARDITHAGLIAWAGTADRMGQAHVFDDRSPCELVISFVGQPPPTDDFVRAVYARFRASLVK